jgi:galactose mutarotase-like enzyme
VRVEYQTDNLDSRALWYGVGAHEAYACPEGIEAYAVEFEKEENLTRAVLSGGLLTREAELVCDRCKTLPIQPSLFANDTQVYPLLASRSVALKSSLHARSVRVDFPDFDYLLIWTKPGAGFLCIEPWSNLPDFIDSDQDITKKPGMTRLLPGQTRTHAHTVAFLG